MKQVFKGIVKTEEGNHVFNDVSEYNKFVQTLIDKGLNFECETKTFTIDEEKQHDEQKNLLEQYGLTREDDKIVATPYYELGEPYYGDDDVNRIKGRMGAFMKYLPYILERMDNDELESYYDEVHEIIDMLEDDIVEANNGVDEITNDLDDMLARLDKLAKEHDNLLDQIDVERNSRDDYKKQIDSAEELKAFYKRIERAIVDAGVNLSEQECCECKNCDGKCNCNKNSCKKYDKTDGNPNEVPNEIPNEVTNETHNVEHSPQDNTHKFECSIKKSTQEIADLITNLFKESDKERLENDGKSLKSDKLSKALEGYEKLLKELFE